MSEDRDRELPRIAVAMSIKEIIALCMMLKFGEMLTKSNDRQHVEAVLKRIGNALVKRGVPRDLADQLAGLG